MDQLLTAGVLVALLITLVRELVSPAAAMVGALVALVLLGVVPPEAAFLGAGNPATITIAALYVVARAMRDHSGLDHAVARLLGDGGARAALMRLVPTVVAVSGVVNNTPLVAACAPLIRGWAERSGVPASKLLMPLSFAAILGGTLTVIGTAPNLVVSGMLQAEGEPGFGFFELLPVGLPVAVLGGVVLVALAPRVLPDRRTPRERVASHRREYRFYLVVEPGGPLEGCTVAEAGLRHLPDAFLAAVVRDGEAALPATPQTSLHGGDELMIVGGVGSATELLARPGLTQADHGDDTEPEFDGRNLVECVIGPNSGLVGSTLKESAFRGRYGGAVLAMHRESERVEGKLGAVQLRPGDALLLLADRAFAERWGDHRDFAVVVTHRLEPLTHSKQLRSITIASFTGMVILASLGVVPVMIAALLACSVLVATRTVRFGRAVESVDLDVLLIVAAAIGIASAVQVSGLAGRAAQALGAIAGTSTPLVALAIVAIGTILLTELVTNVAAAALVLPIAIDVADVLQVDPSAFAVAVAVAASASFLTPVGYQTNTIIYGLGGYRFGDYWRLGLPLTLTTLVMILVVVPRMW